MARKDENGRDLQIVLAYLLNRPVQEMEIYRALDIVAKTYKQRSSRDDFPNAEDCRRVGEHFNLNPLDLMVRFGILRDDHVNDYLDGPFSSRSNTITANEKKSRLTRRVDVPPV